MRVAFLGLGIMGSRMAANLARAGFDLNVWNRTSATAYGWVCSPPGVCDSGLWHEVTESDDSASLEF